MPNDGVPMRPQGATVRTRRGFSLVETLMALLILGLLTAMVAAAIPSAIRAYTNAVNGSNARIAMTTTTTALRDELGMALDVKCNASGEVEWYVDGAGQKCQIKDSSGDASMGEGIKKTIVGTSQTYELIPKSAITKELGICLQSAITYDKDKGVFHVSGLEVRDKDQQAIASVPDYKIQAMGIAQDEGD